MESYYFLFDTLAYINSGLLMLYVVLSVMVLRKSANKPIKIVAFYLLMSFLFDLLSSIFNISLFDTFDIDIFLSIFYRLGELIIIGFLINKYWFKSKIVWILIGFVCVYLVYDLLTYRTHGALNYLAYGQIAANILLVVIIAFNLIKQLQSDKKFSVNNQMLSMVFLTYFAVHLVYTVISNYIINQSFSNKGFTLFYCSYVVLHIVYYFSLAFIVYKKTKPLTTKHLKQLK